MSRLQTRFAQLKEQNRAALVTFVTAGDPNYDTSMAILKGLPCLLYTSPSPRDS